MLALSLAVVFAPLASARAADPYEINVVLPLTGPQAFLGKEEMSALNALESTINKAGGVRGRPIKFVGHDDESSPQIAVQLTTAVLAKNPPVVLGSAVVASCQAMAPLFAKTVQYCFSPSIYEPAGSNVFSASIATTDYLFATVRFMREKGWHKIALLTATDATGQDAEHGIVSAVGAPENRGVVTLVDNEHFNPSDVSVAAQMAHIRASGAQAVILWTNGSSFGTLLRGAVEAGLEIPIMASAGDLIYPQLTSYASFMPKNVYFAAPPWAAAGQLPDGPVKTAVRAYLDAFKATGERPDQGHSLAWDCATLVIGALNKYGFDVTGEQIRSYIAGQRHWVGVNGIYDFQTIPQRGIGLNWLVVVRYDPAGQRFIGVSKPGGMPL